MVRRWCGNGSARGLHRLFAMDVGCEKTKLGKKRAEEDEGESSLLDSKLANDAEGACAGDGRVEKDVRSDWKRTESSQSEKTLRRSAMEAAERGDKTTAVRNLYANMLYGFAMVVYDRTLEYAMLETYELALEWKSAAWNWKARLRFWERVETGVWLW